MTYVWVVYGRYPSDGAYAVFDSEEKARAFAHVAAGRNSNHESGFSVERFELE